MKVRVRIFGSDIHAYMNGPLVSMALNKQSKRVPFEFLSFSTTSSTMSLKTLVLLVDTLRAIFLLRFTRPLLASKRASHRVEIHVPTTRVNPTLQPIQYRRKVKSVKVAIIIDTTEVKVKVVLVGKRRAPDVRRA